jgi:hypothetical protein
VSIAAVSFNHVNGADYLADPQAAWDHLRGPWCPPNSTRRSTRSTGAWSCPRSRPERSAGCDSWAERRRRPRRVDLRRKLSDQSFEDFAKRIALAQELHAEVRSGTRLEIWSTPRWRADGRGVDWSPQRVAEEVGQFEAAGVHWLRVGTDAPTLEQLIDSVHELANRLGINPKISA